MTRVAFVDGRFAYRWTIPGMMVPVVYKRRRKL